jgi:hypothetical protein
MVSDATLVMFSAAITPTLAADYNRLVLKTGDVAEYKVGYWTVRTPVDTLRVIVQDIVGTTVTINSTYYGPFGKIFSNLVTYDIRGPLSSSNNSSDYSFLFPHPLLIAADLGAGDPINVGSESKIDETITMKVANADRWVNHANFSESSSFYWDKATGLLVKLISSIVNLNLTSTTAWHGTTALYFGSSDVVVVLLSIGGIVAIVAIIAVVDHSRRKLWQSNERPISTFI